MQDWSGEIENDTLAAMTAYVGSGPYCYSNSLAMILGAQSPPPSTIEVLTGSPFGAQFVESGAITLRQAKLLGSTQYHLVAGNSSVTAETLEALAPTYEKLRLALRWL